MAPQHQDEGKGVAVIGAGAVGTTLALRLAQVGFPVIAVLSRSPAGARALARRVGAAVASDELAALPAAARLVLCCVPDAAIPGLAAELARVAHPWPETLVLHTSGVLTAGALDPLAARGARTLSFHPAQTFPRAGEPASLEGIFIGLEGGEEAVAEGVRLAALLGARHLVLEAAQKARYHLALSMASNFLVTLVSLVTDLLSSIGIERRVALDLVAPLVETTWRNALGASPEEALTGPIVRGDLPTVEQHGRALARELPQLVPVYAALAAETVRLAVRSGRLDPNVAGRLLERIHALLEPED